MVLTVKTTLWENGFSRKVDRLAREGKLTILEKTALHVSMPGDPGTIPSLAVVIPAN